MVANQAPGTVLLDEVDDVEHRQVQRDDGHADRAADNRDHERFDHGGDTLDDGFKLAAIELADFIEHFAELARFFTRADHLHDAARQQGALVQWRADLLQ